MILKIATILQLFFIVALPLSAKAAVWETRRQWDANWESRYQKWVAEHWDRFSFTKGGFYKDLKVDCADAVYSMRYIFAAENELPFVINDPTGGPNVISNSMTRWDQYDANTRKRMFLTYLFNIVSTKSLPRDSFPVDVNRALLNSGTFLLTDEKNHHSWTVKSISRTGIPYLIFASRPAKTVMFHRYEFPTTPFIFPRGISAETNAGFRAFRQPHELKMKAWEITGFSLEQYSYPAKSWSSKIQAKLQTSKETPTEKMERLLEAVCVGVQERVGVVNDALSFLKKTGQRCLNQVEYDDHSTPSRDARLKGAFDDLASSYRAAQKNGQKIDRGVSQKIDAILKYEYTDYCTVPVARDYSLHLGMIYYSMKNNLLSNNPHDSLEARWGLAAGPGSLARNCPVY